MNYFKVGYGGLVSMAVLKSAYLGPKDRASWKTLSSSEIGFPIAVKLSHNDLNFLRNSSSLVFPLTMIGPNQS